MLATSLYEYIRTHTNKYIEMILYYFSSNYLLKSIRKLWIYPDHKLTIINQTSDFEYMSWMRLNKKLFSYGFDCSYWIDEIAHPCIDHHDLKQKIFRPFRIGFVSLKLVNSLPLLLLLFLLLLRFRFNGTGPHFKCVKHKTRLILLLFVC